MSVIVVFAVSAGIILVAQSGCSGAPMTGTDGIYNTPDAEMYGQHTPVQATTWEGWMPDLTAACQIAGTLAGTLFTGVLDVAYAMHGTLVLTATDNIDDDDDSSLLELDAADGITIFTLDGKTYAAVASQSDDGVQILNVTDPTAITATHQIDDTTTLELEGADGITTFTLSDGNTYAAVASLDDNGVQILNVTDPTAITATHQIDDTTTLELAGASGITTFTLSDGNTYAAVASEVDNGVQILNVTDPTAITATDRITGSSLELEGATAITTFTLSDGNTYAAVASRIDNGVQILNVTDPTAITATAQITDNGSLELEGAHDVTTFTSDGNTYAAVASWGDNGVQILNVTDPTAITATAQITDTGSLLLGTANEVTIFVSDDHTYAAVASQHGGNNNPNTGGVQILDVTDPEDIIPVAQIADSANLELALSVGITTFQLSDGKTYIAVTAYADNGVQIIRVDFSDTTPPVIRITGDNPTVLTVGGTYTERGAVCDDDVDADKQATPSGTVNPNVAGTYTVTYSCTDAAGNNATVSRTVKVEAVPGPTDGAFTTTWMTTAVSESISIPVEVHTSGTLTIYWGDGSAPESVTASGTETHTYAASGEYQVSMTGDLSRINLGASGSTPAKLLSIDQWGDIEWSTMENAFRRAANMEYRATDAPDLSGVTSMSNMFFRASAFNGDLSSWNVSSVTDMSNMFNVATSFDQPLNSWNVSSVTTMFAMFNSATSFDQPLNSWNVSSVTGMSGMFSGATSFNQPLNDWNVSSATHMFYMFFGATSFNQPLNSWNVSSVTGMSGMFSGATSFDGNISGWNVSSVTSMWHMFNGAASFNQPLNSWNVSSVTTMSYMFQGATSFDQPLNSWNVSSATHMFYMFFGATSFNQPLNSWNVSSVTGMSGMFSGATSFDGNISGWNVSSVTSMWHMFNGAASFNQPLNSWNVSSVTDMSNMFNGATSFDQPLNSWNVSSVTGMSGMFSGATSFNQPLNSWNVSSTTGMSSMFQGATSFDQPLNSWNVSSVTGMSGMFRGATSFNQPLNSWNVSSVTTMSSMFSGATTFDQDISSWNVSSVTDMSNMFNGATSFNQNLGTWYIMPATANFYRGGASLYIPPVSAQNSPLRNHSPVYGIGSGGDSNLFEITGSALAFKSVPDAGTYSANVTASGSAVFENGNNWRILVIEAIDEEFDSDAFITTWETTAVSESISIPVEVHTSGTLTIYWGDGSAPESVTASGTETHTYAASGEYQVSMTGDLSRINLGASGSTPAKLLSIDQWGDIEWSTMENAFRRAANMEYRATDAPDLSGVTSMSFMFSGATTFDQDVSSWNVSSVTDMSGMFQSASFDQPLNSWNVSSVTDMSLMFQAATSFNQPLNSWNVSSVTDMSRMFRFATSFDQPLNDWAVSSVTDMSLMFNRATSFNQPLNDWNVSSVTTMSYMFQGATFFNQSLNDWNVSSATHMFSMFFGATSFNQPLNDWDVSSVTTMSNMFNGATSFNQPLNDWAVSSVTTMFGMFNGATSFDQPLNDWNVSSVTTMFAMFNSTTSFDQPLNDWDVSSAASMDSMFSGATSFNQNLGAWYIMPATANFVADGGSLDVTTVSAQNQVLHRHFPVYGIGSGGASNLFEITGSTLAFKATPSAGTHKANVTASGSAVFENGNNWRVLEITVAGSANAPPTVMAGDDLTVAEGTPVSLDATVTDDDTEDTLTYTWTHNSTLSISLDDSSAVDTTFTAPNVSEETDIEFTLTVSDGTASVSDEVLVTITDSANSPPMVNAGNDRQEAEGSTVNLDATVTDTDTEDALTYAWTHNSTLSITLANDSVPDTTFTAPNVSETTVVEFTLTVSDGTASVSDEVLVTITDSANSPPMVNAGNDRQEAEGSTVNLDATVTDTDTEDALTYAWTHNSTLSITLANDSVPDTTFTAPNVSEETDIEFTLTVSDGTASVSDEVLVTITDSANSPPMVNAGNDRQEAEGSTVNLDATVTDTDTEDALTYAWTHNSTLSITLANDSVPDTTFTAPNVSETTVVEFTLTVSDGTASVSDEVLVTITDSANSPPMVNAGNDRQEAEGSTVNLDATVTDTDTEDALTYAWTHNSTLSITLANDSVPDTTFTAPNVSEETDIEFTLTVSDGTASVSDEVLVTITDSANSPPMVNAGNDRQEAEGSTVNLDATVTDTDTEDTLTYTWTHNSTLSITLANDSVPDTTFTAPNVSEETDIEFTLTVSDGTATVSDKTIVTVTDSPNDPPVVNAGDDQDAVVEGSTVNLDATVTDTDTEDALTYAWTHNSTLSITLANDSVPDTTFTAPNVSETTVVEFTLTVSDGTATVSDKTIVTVTDSPNDPPVVNAGDDQDAVVEGSTVNLDATVTDTDTEDALTYAWTHNSTLSITLANDSVPDTTFTAPNVSETTVVEFTLTVSDGTATVSDKTIVTVTDSPNDPPVVNAGDDQDAVVEGSTVNLDATVTDTDTEDALTYAWTHNSTLSITLANDSVPDTTFTAPNVSEETDIEFTLTVSDGTATVSDKTIVTITDSPNDPPEVNAGNDQQEAEGSTVSLDATVTDTDTEDALTYAWTHNSTLSITLANDSVPDTTFTAPNVSEETDIEFTLTVSDGTATVSDKTIVTITDSPNDSPVVNAGDDQDAVVEGSTVNLDATVTDTDTEDALTYAWTHNSTLSITLANDSVPDTTFTAPNVSEETDIEFTLTVSDGTASVSDEVLVTITDSANSPPMVNAGNDRQEAEGSTVNLDATVTDTDTEDTLTYTWTHNSTLSITLANDSVPDTTFTAPNVSEETDIEFTLTVSDGTATVSDKTIVTVTDSPNDPPVVNAGDDQDAVVEGSTVNLDATVTDTDTEDALTYTWTHNSTLSITLANDSVPDTTFTAPNVSETTVVEFTLTVSDGTATVSDKTIVTVTDSPNDPPVVNAGDDQDAVVEGSTVNLDATVTDTDTEDALTYAWTHNSTLSITLANDSVPDTTFTAPNVSETTVVEFTLTVSDGTATVSDKTIVTVTDSPNDPPVVNAGDDQDAVVEGSTVNLDATVTDTDTEDALTYAWTHNSTLSITLANDSVPDTTFTAPNVSEETDIEFTLTVSDGTATVSDKTIVTVTDSPNDPPVVNAGDDQDAVVEGSTVNLDATVTDTDTEDALTYAWTHNSTLSITLANDSVPDTTFTAPNVSEETDIEFTLTVSDGTATVSDKTIVTITDSPNDPPEVNAGNDQQEAEGSTVSLDATVTDTDTEDALTYAWTHNSTLSITLANDSVPDTTFTAPNVSEETDIEFTLTVSDGTATVSDKTIVTITDSPNDSPVVNAGDDQDAVVEGSTVNLDATVTDTDTEDALTYAWTHNSTLSITLANDSVPDTTFTAPNVSEETDIEFTLTVSDGTATVSDKTIVTITDSPNDPPEVNAGNDQQEAEGSTVSLDATVTDTDTEDALTYAWTHNSTLSITLANDSVPDITFTAPNVSEETDIEFTLTVSDGTATVSDKTIVTITDSPNDSPVVNAGDDQDAVVEGSTVNLDATVTDTDTEDALTYAWTHNSTLSITLANDSVPDTTFTAPNVSEETDIEFTLTVSDGTATVSDKTIVTITDSPNDSPVVNAGDDQDAVVEGSTVNLDATVTDTDTEDALTYAWTHNSTLSITLANDSVPDTTFTAPNVSETTVVEFTLTVSDGTATVSDKTIVTITDSPNDPPVVNAGDDQDAVVEGSTVNLDATVTDTDTEDALTYTWTHNSTLSITLANDSVPDTTFTAPNVSEETDIEFTLTVSDGTATVSDKTIVTITDSPNDPPVVNAGDDQDAVVEGSTVNLDATVTDTDTEDALTYTWTHNSTLSITLANDSVPDTTFTAPNVSEETDIEFTLTVSDGTATVSDKTIVTITDSPNDPPVVNAGDDQDAVVEGSTVNLDATVTDTDTEDALTYTWTHNSTLSITLANDSVPDTTFTAPNVSETTVVEFTLTVSDGTATVSDKTIVTITDSPNDPPVVNAGDDQDAVVEGSTVNLDATVTDTDTEDALTYTWTHNSTLSITLANDSVPDTTFTAPNVSETTVVEFTLTVSDGTASVSDEVLVTVTDSPNDPPVVNAGDDQDAVVEGSTVNLDATVTDTDTEDALTYTWTHNSTLSITLANDSVPDTTFTAPNVSETTVVEFTLTVSDGTASVSDEVLVTVTDSPNDPPVVNAGDDQDAVVEGSTVNLDATVTDTDTEDALTYTWTHNSTLSITLANDSVPDTTFTAPNVAENTVVEFTLTVYDGTATVSDKILVTITDSANSPPEVNAGNDQQEAEGSTVSLDATVTDDDTGDTLTYTWTHNSTLSISLDDSSAVDTTFTAPNVAENTVVEFTLTVYDGTATVSDKILVTITDSANSPPMVNAGDDRQEAEGSTVSLDATVTDDDTGDTLTYTWTHNSTLSISLDDSSAVDTTFTAPNVAENTVVEFTLTVYDGTATVSDKILVTITDSANSPPEVNAGNDQQEAEGSTVSLDATVTDDDTGDTLTYTWTHNSTLSISLDDSSAVDTTFTAPNVAENTVVEFTLTVSDGTASVSDEVLVTITDSANSPPEVNAGNDQQEAEGSTVSLDATVTDDDTGDTLTYTWTHNSTLSISLDDSSAVDTTFTAPNVAENTVVEFTLTVYDGTATVSDKILVTITDSANSPPEVNAGNDQQEAEGSTVSLDATVTDDDTGDTLTYTWTHNSTLSISLDDSSAVDTTFTAPNVAENTVVEFTLTVYDGTATVSDKILVTITDSANSPPMVNAGNDQQEAEGSTVSLDATVTDTDTEDALTYTWTHNSTLSISLDDSSAVDTTFTAPNVAENTVVEFTLTVYDGTATVSDKILVTITDSANSPPEVNAGNDQQEAEGSTVSLDATVTDDDTGDTLTYTWTHNSTLSISLDDSSAVDTTFTAPNVAENTVVEFTLTVYDGTATVSDKILVTITDSANSPPEVNAGNDQQEAEGSTVSLDATVTDDDTGDTLTYTWTHNSTLSISLDDSSAVDTTFTAPNVAENTVVEFTLTVYDGTATVSDKILVTITDSANSPPMVNAGDDRQEAEGSTVSLDATVTDTDTEDALTYTWTHNSTLSITLANDSVPDTTFTAPNVSETTVVEFTLTVSDGTASVSDEVLVTITDSANSPLAADASRKNTSSSSSKAPAVHINALAQARIVDIPPHIAEQVASHDASDPLEPVISDGTFDFPLVINGYGYLLDDTTNTLVPQIVTVGDDDPTIITFTVYTQKDLAHFTLYLNLQGENTNYANSDTYITYKDDGTTSITDPHGYIDNATVTVTQEDDSVPERKTVRITVEFGEEPMGSTNMVAYMWNTDRKATFIKIIDAIGVAAALLEPVVQAADPEPLEPDSVLPADPEPVAPDFADDAADPEPVSSDMLWPDDYDEAQVLHIIRMWSGFESEFITDTQLLELLGLEDYQDVDLPDWMMTELGVLVAKGDVTVGEFVLALQYVLENL